MSGSQRGSSPRTRNSRTSMNPPRAISSARSIYARSWGSVTRPHERSRSGPACCSPRQERARSPASICWRRATCSAAPHDCCRRTRLGGLDLLPNLGVALTETGRPEETEALLTAAVEQAGSTLSDAAALRAKVQLLANRVYRSPTQPEVEAAASEAHEAAEALQALGDVAGLAEAGDRDRVSRMDARKTRRASGVGDARSGATASRWGDRARRRKGLRTPSSRRHSARRPSMTSPRSPTSSIRSPSIR